MNTRIFDHFKKVDSKLSRVIEKEIKTEDIAPRKLKRGEYFSWLVNRIICQQLSEKIGDILYGRFQNLFPKGKFTPDEILQTEDLQIRNCGISNSKVSYIKNLSRAVSDKTLNLDRINNLKDEEIVSVLTKVKGIGRWTAEMFLMFAQGREDIFSAGDLGIKRGIERVYGLKNPTIKEMEKISFVWSPYRTYACLILWRSNEK